MKYDDVSWHTGGDYPEGLPPENAATHIGMFLAWCLQNGLASSELAEMSGDDIRKVAGGDMTGAQFLLENCDGKFWDADLSEEGQAFAADYYEDSSAFAKKVGSYMADYCEAIDESARELGAEYPSAYHYEDSKEHFAKVASLIDKRYNKWKEVQSANGRKGFMKKLFQKK